MEITDVTVHSLSVDAVEGEKADGTQDAAIIEVETDEGLVGVGEADASPAVVKAVVEAPVSHSKSSGLAEVVVGRDPFDAEVLWNEMYERTYFYGRKGAAIVAISGIDMALWDLMGKATGRPVHQLLGGKHRDAVRAYASTLFPADPADLDHVREEAGRAMDAGFTAIKFGWGAFGESLAADHALLGAAREVIGDEVDLMADAGMVWGQDWKAAVKHVGALDRDHDLFWIEEPVYADDLDAYRRLSSALDTRVVGGEEEYTVYGFGDFIDRGRPDGVQPDVARSGGITQMVKIATLAREAGIPLYPHGYSTDVIVAANLQLMAAVENAPLLEYCVEDSPLRWDVTVEDFDVVDGEVAVPDDPGLGVTLDRGTLERYGADR